MSNSLQFLFTVYIICIVLSCITVVSTLIFVIPLQVKQAGVKNGLSSLRHKLLANGFLLVFISLLEIIILSSRFFLEGDAVRYTNTILILVFTVALSIKSLIWSSILHTQFTEDQIKLHHKIWAEEQRLKKNIVKREVVRTKLNADRRKVTADRKKLTSKD